MTTRRGSVTDCCGTAVVTALNGGFAPMPDTRRHCVDDVKLVGPWGP